MQNRYVPDLGDFSKFAVIDALAGNGKDRAALVWYLVDPYEVGDQHKNDGKHTGYLENDRQGLSLCHPELYARLQAIHATGEKHVGVYAKHNVLANIDYFSERLSYEGKSLAERPRSRGAWLSRALEAAVGSCLVVLDPDNGLMPDRLTARSRSAVKYATLDECKAFYASGRRTLVVYQHAHRQGRVQAQAEHAMCRLTQHLSVPRERVFALRFHRGTTRFYLVVPKLGGEGLLRERASSITQGLWGQGGHFSLVE